MGSSEPLPVKRNGFIPIPWESWLRMFVSFLCGALSVSFFIGGKTRDISELLKWQGEMIQWQKKVEDEGTRWARFNTDEQKKTNEQQNDRISALEKHEEMHAVMRQKLDRLEDDVKELKTIKK